MKWDAGSSRAGPIPSACQALTDGYLHYDLHYIHCDMEHGARSLVGAGQLDLTDYARQTCAALNEFLIACNLHKYYTTWFPYLKLLNWTCLILDELCAWALAITDWQRSLVSKIIFKNMLIFENILIFFHSPKPPHQLTEMVDSDRVSELLNFTTRFLLKSRAHDVACSCSCSLPSLCS